MPDVAIPDRTHADPVHLGQGVSCQWLYDGKVILFKLPSTSRSSIDTWIAGVDHVLSQWPPDEPIRIMHEIASIPLTPYLRQQSEAIIQRHADHAWGRLAVVLRPGVFTSVIRFFAERELNTLNPNMIRRIFTSREGALTWLNEPIQKPGRA